MPVQHGRIAAGQVPASRRRDRRAARAGCIARSDLPAVPDRVGRDRAARRHRRPGIDLAGSVAGASSAGGVRGHRGAQCADVPAYLRAGRGRCAARRRISRTARQPGAAGAATEDPVRMIDMQIQPILAALRRHRLAVFLIAMEIALACAILCNALFLVFNRIDMMRVRSGVDESRLVVVSLEGVDKGQAADLAARLRAGFAGIGGVESVGIGNAVPFTQRAGEMGFRLIADDMHYTQQGHFYVGDPQFASTLGITLASGRWFTPDEYGPMGDFLPRSPSALIDAAYARKLWPGQDPLGKSVYTGTSAYRVV